MKKLGIMTATVALALLCGCTQEDIQVVYQPSEHRISLTTDYTIKADVSTSEKGTTRASYETLSDANSEIGIYCLPARRISATASNPNWTTDIDPNNYAGTIHNAYWGNVKCSVTDQGTGIYSLAPVDDQNILGYYPMTSIYGYDFYGYAPYTEVAYRTSSWVAADIDLDGTKDIIHGVAKTPEESLGDVWGTLGEELQAELNSSRYSARYFRKAKQKSEVEMVFSHKLVKLNFNVIPCADGEGSFESVNTLAVKSVTLKQLSSKVRLYVAHTGDKTGTFVELPAGNPTTNDFYLNKIDGEGNWGVPTDTLAQITACRNKEEITASVEPGDKADPIQIGTYMMVVPKTSYTMEIVLCSKDNPESLYPAKTLTMTGNFEAGHEYNVNVSVEGPTAINLISAELVDWIEGDDVDINYFDE